jgi:hypothetical protein
MIVRYKLDTCGIKLKLEHWHQFTTQERQQTIDNPCTTPAEIQAYRSQLQSLVIAKTGSPPKDLEIDRPFPWENLQQIPATTQAKVQDLNLSLSLDQWASLSALQRFVLIKLSQPSHENRNFLPALKEFGLVDTGSFEPH